MKIICEKCKKNTANVDFSCYMSSFGEFLSAEICMECYETAESDLKLAVEIVGIRINELSVPKPMPLGNLPQFFPKDYKERYEQLHRN